VLAVPRAFMRTAVGVYTENETEIALEDTAVLSFMGTADDEIWGRTAVLIYASDSPVVFATAVLMADNKAAC
jgi:chorismate-pyruvate lyase